MLVEIVKVVAHSLPYVQAARDAGIQNINTDDIRRYLDIITEGRLAMQERLKREREGR